MIRSLLITTATVALMAGGVQAQEAGASQESQQTQESQGQDTELKLEAVDTPAQPGVAGQGGAGGQEVVVNSGDTIVIQPTGEGIFTLNFRVGAGAATQVGTPTPAAQSAVVQRDQMQPADPEQLSVDNLLGSEVYGVNDENIGEVGDVLLTEQGEVDALVVDVGGFLGIGTHTVAIGVDNLQFMVDAGENWYVFTPFTQEQLEAQPAYDPDTYGQQRDQQRMTVEG